MKFAIPDMDFTIGARLILGFAASAQVPEAAKGLAAKPTACRNGSISLSSRSTRA